MKLKKTSRAQRINISNSSDIEENKMQDGNQI